MARLATDGDGPFCHQPLGDGSATSLRAGMPPKLQD